MKAVFKGYLDDSEPSHVGVYFTVGKIYDLIPSEVIEGFYNVIDDDGYTHLLRPSKLVYDFEFLPEDKPLTCSKLFDDSYGHEMMMNEILSNPQIDQRQFTFYINGVSVTKKMFDSVLLSVKDFEAEGVDASSIKFELKFE